MTSLKQLKLLLIACVSFNRSPVAPLCDNLSEPAKSIRFKVPSHVSSVIELKKKKLKIKKFFFLLIFL